MMVDDLGFADSEAFVVVGSIPTLCILVMLPESTCHIGRRVPHLTARSGRSGSAALQGHPDERGDGVAMAWSSSQFHRGSQFSGSPASMGIPGS